MAAIAGEAGDRVDDTVRPLADYLAIPACSCEPERAPDVRRLGVFHEAIAANVILYDELARGLSDAS